MGYHPDPADFAQPRQARGGGDLPAAEWTLVPAPAQAAGHAPQARALEMSRYGHYRALPGRAGRRGGRRVHVPAARAGQPGWSPSAGR